MRDPPSYAWSAVIELIVAVSEKNGSNRYIGRRLPRLLGQAGLADVRVNPIVHVPAPGDARRTLLVDFVDNLRERITALEETAFLLTVAWPAGAGAWEQEMTGRHR